MQASVAAAADGTAAVAWTVQADARLVLRAARINGSGQPSAVRDLSTPPHSVDAFTVTAGTRRLAVAWRERDSTSSSLLAATLPAAARTWSQPTVVATGPELGTPIVRDGRFGPVVVWTSHGSTGAGLHAARIDQRGQAGRQFALVVPRRAQRIATPGVTATADGVLVAWCASAFQHASLRVALITATAVHPTARPLASCSGTSPHLLRVGNHIVVNASRVPRLYELTRRLRCTRMDAVHTAGAYRLVASSLGIDAVSAAGSANGAVAVRGLARPERDDPPASQDDLCSHGAVCAAGRVGVPAPLGSVSSRMPFRPRLHLVASVIMVTTFAHALAASAADGTRAVDAARARAAFASMQHYFYTPVDGLYEGTYPRYGRHAYSLVWPFSQALAATVSLAAATDGRRAYRATLAAEITSLGLYWKRAASPPGGRSIRSPRSARVGRATTTTTIGSASRWSEPTDCCATAACSIAHKPSSVLCAAAGTRIRGTHARAASISSKPVTRRTARQPRRHPQPSSRPSSTQPLAIRPTVSGQCVCMRG